MAVVFDNATENEGGGSRSFAHTVTGPNPGLVVFVCSGDGAIANITGVTYNAIALTQIRIDNSEGEVETQVWSLEAPATGSNTVVVTDTTGNTVIAAAVSFRNTNQSTLVSNHAGAVGGSGTPTVSPNSALNRMVTDMVGYRRGDGAAAPGAGQTERWNSTEDRPESRGSTEVGAVPSVTMSWDNPDDEVWALTAVDINDVETSPGNLPKKYDYQVLLALSKTTAIKSRQYLSLNSHSMTIILVS